MPKRTEAEWMANYVALIPEGCLVHINVMRPKQWRLVGDSDWRFALQGLGREQWIRAIEKLDKYGGPTFQAEYRRLLAKAAGAVRKGIEHGGAWSLWLDRDDLPDEPR